MFYRFNADELMYEVLDSTGRVICMTGTEQEAQEVIKQRYQEQNLTIKTKFDKIRVTTAKQRRTKNGNI